MLIKTNDVIVDVNIRITEEHIDNLARSMQTIGQITPISVSRNEIGWHLVAGHRRLLAAKQLGWEEIRAEEVDIENLRAVQLAENISRDELTDYEIAQGVLILQQEDGLTQAQIADALGMDKKVVSTYQKIAKGSAGLDALSMNQLPFGDLKMYAEVHDMPADMREDFIADHEKEDFRSGVWRVPDYIEEVASWRWSQRKANKALLQAFDDAGSVPMSKQDRHHSVRLHGAEVETHRGQPCHGWLIVKTWSNVDEGYEFAEYCLDPASHREAVNEETGEADDELRKVAKVAERTQVKGINPSAKRDKEVRARKQLRKEAVVDFARNPKIKPLTEAIFATLLNIQKPYRWNELGKAYGLTKPKDQYHFEWDDYLNGFADKEQLIQSLILAVGSVYINLESTYQREDSDLLIKLDEIFGFNKEGDDGGEPDAVA